MTIKNLKELLARVEALGVPEDTEVYSEQARCNETDCIVIVKDLETDGVTQIYISDSSPDELEESLNEDGNTVEILY